MKNFKRNTQTFFPGAEFGLVQPVQNEVDIQIPNVNEFGAPVPTLQTPVSEMDIQTLISQTSHLSPMVLENLSTILSQLARINHAQLKKEPEKMIEDPGYHYRPEFAIQPGVSFTTNEFISYNQKLDKITENRSPIKKSPSKTNHTRSNKKLSTSTTTQSSRISEKEIPSLADSRLNLGGPWAFQQHSTPINYPPHVTPPCDIAKEDSIRINGANCMSAVYQINLLQHWIPVLERLSPVNKTQIWETCILMPEFRNYNITSYKKTINEWAKDIASNSNSIIIMFGAIGYLKQHGILKNDFYFLDSNSVVFRTFTNENNNFIANVTKRNNKRCFTDEESSNESSDVEIIESSPLSSPQISPLSSPEPFPILKRARVMDIASLCN